MNKKFIFRWKTFLCSIEDGNKQLNLYLIQSFTRWHSSQMKEKFFRVPGSPREEKHISSSAADVFMVTEMKRKSESHSEAQSVVFASNSSLIDCGFLWCFEHSCVYAVPLGSSPNQNKKDSCRGFSFVETWVCFLLIFANFLGCSSFSKLNSFCSVCMKTLQYLQL